MGSEDDELKRREAEKLRQSNAVADAAQHNRSIVAAIASDKIEQSTEKRRRAQAAANTDEAVRKRTNTDPFTGE